ncbi:MAG TPA: hemerythrin domain-containing protein [Burkholderiaceae bacterium]|nr:hemerythrin domain-containing protein [Burkholderiaceae bacterium]
MSTLQWSDALWLDLPAMDDTHREFVDLLAAVEAAPDDQLAAAWRALIEHTEDHFAREDRWMRDTRFASGNCHTTQHLVVLQVMRETEANALAGPAGLIRAMAVELGRWFPQHAQGMDAALALHLRRVGYDVATGQVSLPQALPVEEIRGCASAACSPAA